MLPVASQQHTSVKHRKFLWQIAGGWQAVSHLQEVLKVQLAVILQLLLVLRVLMLAASCSPQLY